MHNAGNPFNGLEIPLQPWAEALYKQRQENFGIDRPDARCLPPGVPNMYVFLPHKIIHAPGLVVILHEASTGDFYRQIFTDGRELPKDPNPT